MVFGDHHAKNPLWSRLCKGDVFPTDRSIDSQSKAEFQRKAGTPGTPGTPGIVLTYFIAWSSFFEYDLIWLKYFLQSEQFVSR